MEKRSKSSIVWTGTLGATSGAMSSTPTKSPLPNSIEGIKVTMEKVRAKVDHYYREEAMLDSWIATLKTQYKKQQQKAAEYTSTIQGDDNEEAMPLNFVLSKDIIEALYYPVQPSNPPNDATMIMPEATDSAESPMPQSSIIAVHAPANSVIEVSAEPNAKKYRMEIAEKTDLEKIRDEMKRKAEEENLDPYSRNRMVSTKRSRISLSDEDEESPIQVFLMPVEYNSKLEKTISGGAKLLPSDRASLQGEDSAEAPNEEGDETAAGGEGQDWDCSTLTLKPDEGVADFFG